MQKVTPPEAGNSKVYIRHFTHFLEIIKKTAPQLQVTSRNIPEHLSILVLMLSNITESKISI
jgi:hypothetical protein